MPAPALLDFEGCVEAINQVVAGHHAAGEEVLAHPVTVVLHLERVGVGLVREDVQDINRAQMQIYLDPEMSQDEKKVQDDELQKLKNGLMKEAYELRPGGAYNPLGEPDLSLLTGPAANCKFSRLRISWAGSSSPPSIGNMG